MTRAFNYNDLSLKMIQIWNQRNGQLSKQGRPETSVLPGRLIIRRFREANSLASLQTDII